MDGIYLVISLLGCVSITLHHAGAYYLRDNEDFQSNKKFGVDESEKETSSKNTHDSDKHSTTDHQVGGFSSNNNEQEEGEFSNKHSQGTGQYSSSNMQGAEPFNQQQFPNYQQGASQIPNYQQGVPNYQQGTPQFPNYQQGSTQVGNYQQGVPQAPNYQQGVPQPPNYQQGVPQAPNYQQGPPTYNTPGHDNSHPVLSENDPEELVKDKSESELRKLVAKALKEMKEIADTVMFWHHKTHKDHQENTGQQLQPSYTNPSFGQQQYYNPNSPQPPPFQQTYGNMQTNPQQFSGQPVPNPQPLYVNQQSQPPPQPYGNMQTNPQQFSGQPVPNLQMQPYGSPQPLYVNQQSQPPPQPYGNPMYGGVQPQYNPQPYYNQPQQPSGTIQFQRLVRHLFGYLQSLPGQSEVDQQYYTQKLWSAPQQQAANQQSEPQQSQLSPPLTVSDSFVKSVVQSLPPMGVPATSYVPPYLVHAPPGIVVVAPHYFTPLDKAPQVSLVRSQLQYGFPILIHENSQ